MSASSPTPTATVHSQPYAALDPSRPSLSQHKRAALVTGSSSGIGFAIARSFAKANAAVVILTGRQEKALDEAVQRLSGQFPNTKIVGKKLDISDSAAVNVLWNSLDEEELVVDVLVLNAARNQSQSGPILGLDYNEVFADYVTNVGANMQFVDRFYHQNKRDTSRQLVRQLQDTI